MSICARLNIAVDKLIGKNPKAPLTINIKNTPIVVYVNDTYISNNYLLAIRNYFGEKEATNFMIKYDWSPKVISNIEWKLLDSYIKNKSYSTKKMIKKSSIIGLPPGIRITDNHYYVLIVKSLPIHPYLMITSSLDPNQPLERKRH